MAITVTERPDSRERSGDKITLRYLISGTDDGAAAKAALLAEAPATLDGLYRSDDDADIEPVYADTITARAAYKGKLFGLTGKINDASFKGFAAGEVLFLGASGSRRSDDDWEIAFEFASSPNKTGLEIGGITGIAKKGWQYLWVRYSPRPDALAKVLIQYARYVYVHDVYEEGDFSDLGIGTE